ncbi:MAG: hypothetical protein WC205_14995 [Opitutaceae bacterium]|jgi:hypothetical protein
MSLINEALKKAQRQRTEDPVATPPPSPSTPTLSGIQLARIPKRKTPLPASTLLLLLGGGFAVLLMGGIFAVVFLVPDKTPPPVIKTTAVTPPSQVSPITTPVTPVTPVSPVAPITPVATTPPTVDTTPEPPVVSVKLPPIVTPSPTPPVEVAPVIPPTPTPPPVTEVKVPVANPKVYEFLEALRVSGIRVSATDPKVIMNDRVFRLNDVVDKPTHLRLTRVDASSLTFTDDKGFEYQKSF